MKKLKREGKRLLEEANAKIQDKGLIQNIKIKIKPLKFETCTLSDGSGYWYYASVIEPVLGFEIDNWSTSRGEYYKPFVYYKGDTHKLLTKKPVSLVKAIELCNKAYRKILKNGRV